MENFSYEKSVKLARNINSIEKVREELGNPFTLPYQSIDSLAPEEIDSMGFAEKTSDFLRALDKESLRYFFYRVNDISKLSHQEKGIIELLCYVLS